MWLYSLLFPLEIIMHVSTTNAVNLKYGLDGLAPGTIAFATFGLAVLAYIKGNFILSQHFQMEYIQEAGELTIFTAGMIGTVLGFLWFNTKPAEIFMGDTGSLTLGGLLAVLAILLREEILFGMIGAIFVVEALSSMIQTYYFKYTRIRFGTGKRVFLRAPIHHHFEMKGMSEEKIVIRFWIIAALLTAIGLATIKLR